MKNRNMQFVNYVFLFFSLMSICFVTSMHAETHRTIYLTSDDGPLSGTENIIKVISEKQVPITMFMVGLHYEEGGETRQRWVELARKNPFIEIGSHSYSHAYDHYRHFYHRPKVVLEDLEKNIAILRLGNKPIHTRFPGRSVFRLPTLKKDDTYISKEENKVEIIDDDLVYSKGFYLYGWDLEWTHDRHGKPIQTVERLVNEIEDKFEKNQTVQVNKLILLMHDEMFRNHFNGETNLKHLISLLQKKKYKFDFIKNYSLN